VLLLPVNTTTTGLVLFALVDAIFSPTAFFSASDSGSGARGRENPGCARVRAWLLARMRVEIASLQREQK
jgi:hypothetical protein